MNVSDNIIVQIFGSFFLSWAAVHYLLVARRLLNAGGGGDI